MRSYSYVLLLVINILLSTSFGAQALINSDGTPTILKHLHRVIRDDEESVYQVVNDGIAVSTTTVDAQSIDEQQQQRFPRHQDDIQVGDKNLQSANEDETHDKKLADDKVSEETSSVQQTFDLHPGDSSHTDHLSADKPDDVHYDDIKIPDVDLDSTKSR